MPAAAGHTVLAVPVPALDAIVRARTAFYDRSFVSADPHFCHAHITLLAPWARGPAPADLARVAAVARQVRAFQVTLAELGEFPDGIIYLIPRPDGQLRALAATLAAAFPQYPPYQGRYAGVVPHLTLDRRSAAVTPATVRASAAAVLPATVTLDRIDLQWWASDDCRLLGSWPLR